MEVSNKNYLGSIHVRRPSCVVIGSNCVFHNGCYLWPTDDEKAKPHIIIGSNNAFGRNVTIESHVLVRIGDNIIIGPDTYIIDSDHESKLGVPPIMMGIHAVPVYIGNNCWIGTKVIILKGVHLGQGCIVGAGAVVTHSFAANSVVAGVPARILRERHVETTLGSEP